MPVGDCDGVSSLFFLATNSNDCDVPLACEELLPPEAIVKISGITSLPLGDELVNVICNEVSCVVFSGRSLLFEASVIPTSL